MRFGVDRRRRLVPLRLSDVLKVGGENVSAAEVEDRIAGLPGVSVVAAPDGHYGEVAAAFVELRPGAVLTEAEVTGPCLEQLATFKVPRYLRFVSEWPMSGTKIQKGQAPPADRGRARRGVRHAGPADDPPRRAGVGILRRAARCHATR